MHTSSSFFGTLVVLAMGLGVVACTAVNDSQETFTDDDGTDGDASGGAGASSSTGDGGGIGIGGSGVGGSTGSGPLPTEITCPKVAQDILVLDFRCGWWSGGGGGQFHQAALSAVAQTCGNTTVEYHHFETFLYVKCLASGNAAPTCQELFQAPPATPDAIKALFEKPKWDDYTQIWVLSGSDMDSTDVALSGSLFEHFLGETKGSCIPALIGAGDGFITHGNSVAAELGIGNALTTEFTMPGFFSVAQDPIVTVGTRMYANAELASHILFQGVDSIADTVSNSTQNTHGDSVVDSPAYQVIAHDSAGRPTIAVGSVALPNDGDRPFIIDAGFQRYYGMTPGEGTHKLLQNMVQYLGSVGCKAEEPK